VASTYEPFDGFDVYAISTAERHNQLILPVEPADDYRNRLTRRAVCWPKPLTMETVDRKIASSRNY
jgi:hypothetical protein